MEKYFVKVLICSSAYLVLMEWVNEWINVWLNINYIWKVEQEVTKMNISKQEIVVDR